MARSQAVCLAQEIKLGKLETFPLTDPIDIAWRRSRERMWYVSLHL